VWFARKGLLAAITGSAFREPSLLDRPIRFHLAAYPEARILMRARPVIGGNRLIKFIKRWKNWWCAVIALVVTLGFALSYTPGLFLALRSPTERETVLYYFAQNIGEPALCE
jgi:hypothetical protein